MEIAPVVGKQPGSLVLGGGAQIVFDLGEDGVERLDGGRDHGLHLQRRHGDAEAAGAPGKRRCYHLLAVLDVAQDAARVLYYDGFEPSQADVNNQNLGRLEEEL